MNQDSTGTVFDIQRFSIHDGPGIRTTVFLKGCSLRCFWCHNPESVRAQPELEIIPERCIGCGDCVAICPQGACSLVDGKMAFSACLCDGCMRCVETCYAGALVASGRRMSASEVVEEVLRDRSFYRESGGGVTLSGGEPVLQARFARAILAACHEAGIHTAVETAGNYAWRMLEGLLPVLDLVMMDLKHLDADSHRRATGASNARILENARRLALTDRPLLFRTPVVPTVNDTPRELEDIARFVADLARLRAAQAIGAPLEYQLLTFHQMASDKYAHLGREYRARTLTPLTAEKMERLNALLRDVAGLHVHGGIPGS